MDWWVLVVIIGGGGGVTLALAIGNAWSSRRDGLGRTVEAPTFDPLKEKREKRRRDMAEWQEEFDHPLASLHPLPQPKITDHFYRPEITTLRSHAGWSREYEACGRCGAPRNMHERTVTVGGVAGTVGPRAADALDRLASRRRFRHIDQGYASPPPPPPPPPPVWVRRG